MSLASLRGGKHALQEMAGGRPVTAKGWTDWGTDWPMLGAGTCAPLLQMDRVQLETRPGSEETWGPVGVCISLP